MSVIASLGETTKHNKHVLGAVNPYLLWSNWLLGSLAQLLDGLVVVTKILLAANQDNWKALAEVQNLGNPL